MEEIVFERIEKYIQGKLPPAEQVRFESEIETDEALRNEVALQRKLMKSIETESVRQLLAHIHEENFAKETKIIPMRQRRLYPIAAIAASITLLIVVGWGYFNWQANRPYSLYTAYFSPAAGLPTTLSYSKDTRFAEGMVSYKLGDYSEAREWWQPLLQADPKNDTLNFYMGVALLADEQPGQALQYLNGVLAQSNSVLYPDAQWFAALAYLHQEDKEKAKVILTELSAQESAYQKESQELLEKL